jgi:hypothetical protein
VARTCKCYRQMSVYVQKPVVGGKQTTRFLNHRCFIVAAMNVHCDVWRSWQSDRFRTSVPTLQLFETILNDSRVYPPRRTAIFTYFSPYILPFPNELANGMMLAREMHVHSVHIPPSDGKINKLHATCFQKYNPIPPYPVLLHFWPKREWPRLTPWLS